MYSINRHLAYEPGIVYNRSGVGSSRLKQRLMKKLEETQGCRCAVCGRITNKNESDNLQMTVEHIKPKSIFTEKRNEWANLIGCCRQCNLKRAKNEEKVEKTDYIDVVSAIDTEYFNLTDFLFLNEFSGEIQIRSTYSSDSRLVKTLKVYEFNSESLKEERIRFINIIRGGSLNGRIQRSLSSMNLDNPLIIFPFILMTLSSCELYDLIGANRIIEIYKERR